MKILCVGQSAYDITLPMNSYPTENKKYRIQEQIECGGGSSNNAAYLLSMWGNEVYLASCIGKDNYGKRIKDELIKGGVKVDFLEEREEANTTISYIINNISNGSRTILTNKSPLMHCKKNDIDIKPDVLFLDGNEYQLSLDLIKKNPNALKIIDAGSIKEGMEELCSLCDYVVCSNDFAKEYTHIDFKYEEIDRIKKAYDVLEKNFQGKVIITLESHGSIVKIDNEYCLIPSIKVKSVDSTGAGDIYHGAITHFIIHGYPLKQAVFYANIAGALSVTKLGGKSSMPMLDEVLSYHEL